MSELPDVISFAFNMDTERARKMYLDCIIREVQALDPTLILRHRGGVAYPCTTHCGA